MDVDGVCTEDRATKSGEESGIGDWWRGALRSWNGDGVCSV